MPARSQKTTIAISGSGGSQCSIFADALDTLITSCGGKLLQQSGTSGTGFARARMYRMPHFDYRKSNPNLVLITTATGTVANGALVMGGFTDFDPSDYAAQPLYPAVSWDSGIIRAQFAWAVPASWPSASAPSAVTTGQPDVAGAYSGAFPNFGNGNHQWVIDQVASEYGIFWLSEDSVSTYASARCIPFYPQHMARDIELRASVATPCTFAAPAGSAHLIFECDGAEIAVTFRTGVALSASDIARAITMQGADTSTPGVGGYLEARRYDFLPRPSEGVKVRIPTDRAPSAFYNAETRPTPRLALVYQDAECTNAGLDLRLWYGTLTTVGATTLYKAAVNWPLLDARVGGTVFNQTRGDSVLIERFTTTTTTYDTIVVDGTTPIPGTWLAGDSYEVLPGPEGQLQGSGAYGAIAQVVNASDPTADILGSPGGADTEVVCDDLFGECYSHFEVGQIVPIHNNGCAVILDVVDVTGFMVGETVSVTAPVGRTGTTGIVRGIKVGTNQLVVDTISGYVGNVVGAEAKGVPWAAGDTIASSWGTGSTDITAVDSSTARGTMGWSALLYVVAKSRMDLPGGDMRTKLTLQTSEATVNAGLTLMACAVIGINAKVGYQAASFNGSIDVVGMVTGASTQLALQPYVYGLTYISEAPDDRDVRRNEVNVLPSQPSHTPDYETSSLEVAEIVARGKTTANIGAHHFGALAHMRGITATGAPLSPGDYLDEDRDPNRTWKVSERTVTNQQFGAQTSAPARVQYLAIGPGAAP